MTDNQTNTTTGQRHTWSQAAESVGCGLILCLFVLAVIVVCAWTVVQTRGH